MDLPIKKETSPRGPAVTSASGITRLTFGHVCFLLFCIVCLWMATRPIPAEDMWFYLKTGQITVDTKTIPHLDTYSFTAANLPWTNHEWLSMLFFYLGYKLGGFKLLYIYKLTAILASYLLLLWLSYRRTGGNLAIASLTGLLMLAIVHTETSYDLRSFTFTYFFTALTVVILEIAYTDFRKSWLLYILIPVTLIWLNSHGGFILSYVLQLIYLTSYILSRIVKKYWVSIPFLTDLLGRSFPDRVPAPSEEPQKTRKPPDILIPSCAVFILSLLVGIINPYGIKTFLFPFSFATQDYFREHIIEWRRPELFTDYRVFTVTAILLAILAVVYRKHLKITDFLIFIAFTYLATTALRHIPIFTFVVYPVAAVLLYQWSRCLNLDRITLTSFIMWAYRAFIILFLAAALGLGCYLLSDMELSRLNMEQDRMPVGGVEFLKENQIPGRMFNAYEWGGYIIWKLNPQYLVMMDGRANTVYTEEVYSDHIYLAWGSEEWEKLLDKYKINFCICNKFFSMFRKQYLILRLEHSPHWVMIYEDSLEKIFIRNTPENTPIIEKARKGELHMPKTAFTLNHEAFEYMIKGDYGTAEPLLRQAVAMNPHFVPALVNLGQITMQQGRLDDAEHYYRSALKYNDTTPMSNFMLGTIYEKRRDFKRARACYLKELLIDPFSPQASSAYSRTGGFR